MNLLLSAACSLGLLLAVSLTVANGGRRLIADCHPGLLDPLLPLDQGPGRADCPFDPTRIYVSACSSQPFCSLQVLVLACQPPLHACPAPSQFPTFLLRPRIQPWLSGSLLCSCLQRRLPCLVTAAWLHSLSVGWGPTGRKGFRSR